MASVKDMGFVCVAMLAQAQARAEEFTRMERKGVTVLSLPSLCIT